MKAAIYARVSTSSQEDGASLPTQVEACRASAEFAGYDVPAAFTYEEVFSGSELWNRPALSQMRADLIKSRRIDALYAYSTDRLARDPVHLLILLEEAQRYGIDVVFVTEPFENSDEGMLIQYVRGYAAKLEREKIKERTLRGKLAKVRSGKLLGSGRSLYGYRTEDGRRHLEEGQAVIVDRIFVWAANGTPTREIVRRLDKSGVASPSGRSYWSRSTINRILHEPAYAGCSYAWRWKRRGSRLVERCRDEWIELPEGTTPAIVDQCMWDAVQQRLQRNKQLATRNAANPERYLLRGYVRCGGCGYPMWTDARERENRTATSYRCRGQTAHRDSTCQPGLRPQISSRNLDDWVWDRVREVLSDPELVKREVERLRSEPVNNSGERRLDAAMNRNLTQQEGLLGAIAELGGCGGEEDKQIRRSLLEKLRGLQAERDRLELERQEMAQQVCDQLQASRLLEGVLDWCEQVRSRLNSFGYAEKRLAVEAVGAEVFVYPRSHIPRAELLLHLPGKALRVAVPTTC